MPRLLLVTFQLLPAGEPGADLIAPLRARGIDAAWASWDDPHVEWSAADAVAVRSAWDYHRRTADFLAWARRVEESTLLLNGADLFTWNADKAYLLELGVHVPVVPTALVDDATLVPALGAAFEAWGTVVVKPRTGAGGAGVVVAERLDDPRLEGLAAGPWIVQPLVDSVRTDGERSVFVLDGRAVSQVDKTTDGAEEIRVHELYGGRSVATALDPGLARRAEDAVRAATSLTGHAAAYARVDLMRWDGDWVVSELELIEPGLYLDVEPANAERFADLVAGLVGSVTPASDRPGGRS